MEKTRMTREEELFYLAYKTIKGKANSNSFIQGATGIVGFPSTLVVDGVVIFTHYEPLINDIRKLYGRSEISSKELSPMMGGLVKEILVDVAIDKFLGNVPIAGAYFNAVSAKALTWRLGMLITVLSARGEEFSKENIANVIKLIRYINPLSEILKFKKPDYEVFKHIVLSVDSNEMSDFESKVQSAIKSL